jgi:hypothetical protein
MTTHAPLHVQAAAKQAPKLSKEEVKKMRQAADPNFKGEDSTKLSKSQKEKAKKKAKAEAKAAAAATAAAAPAGPGEKQGKCCWCCVG